MPLVLAGATSGSTTIQATDATTQTVTLPSATGTAVLDTATQTLTNKTLTSPTITGASVSSMASSVLTSGTAQNTTSGTSIPFTGIPSWVKRITVILNGISLSGSAYYLLQLGSGSTTVSGYISSGGYGFQSGSTVAVNTTNGFNIQVAGVTPANTNTYGTMIFTNVSGNIWVASGCGGYSTTAFWTSGGSISLGGVLDRVIITTSNGTDTFDAGSVNILYE